MLLFLCINERVNGAPWEKKPFFLIYIYSSHTGHKLQPLIVSFAPRGQNQRPRKSYDTLMNLHGIKQKTDIPVGLAGGTALLTGPVAVC